MKRKISLIGLIMLSIVAYSVNTNAQNEPVLGYEGKVRPEEEVATFRFTGNKMAVRLWIFKVDGKLTSASFYNTYNCTPTGNINLKLLPGKHELEIQSTTNSPQILTFTCEAGKEYMFELGKDQVTIIDKSDKKETALACTVQEVPLYSEIPETEPYATLIEEGKGNGSTILFRIDGLAGKILARGWVAHHVFNNLRGNYSVRLTPGEHELEYSGNLGSNNIVVTQKYNFEAGKTYTITYKEKEVGSLKYLASSMEEVK
jgi:hypothetical protein